LGSQRIRWTRPALVFTNSVRQGYKDRHFFAGNEKPLPQIADIRERFHGARLQFGVEPYRPSVLGIETSGISRRISRKAHDPGSRRLRSRRRCFRP
jgi:hypothetical protein